jgi:hypothetical protein
MRYASTQPEANSTHHRLSSSEYRNEYFQYWVFRTNVTADFGIVTKDFGPS